MLKFDWRGVSGQYFFRPGKVRSAKCSICGAKMNVSRNVLVSTCLAESLSGKKHRSDHFSCPRQNEDWHERISFLKMAVYREVLRRHDQSELRKLKKSAKKEILKLLKNHVAR